MHTLRHTLRTLVVGVIATTALLAAVAVEAQAASPVLQVRSFALPTHFVPGNSDGAAMYVIRVTNVGAAPTDGTPITITDSLPAGLTAHPGAGSVGRPLSLVDNEHGADPSFCDPGPPVTCSTPPSPGGLVGPLLSPGGFLTMYVPVDVAPPAVEGTIVANHVAVSGGGAPSASAVEQTPVSANPAPFGFQDSGLALTDAAGNAATQAGSHPRQLNTFFDLDTIPPSDGGVLPAASLKNVKVKLPPGLIVNPQATPVRCTEAQLETHGPDIGTNFGPACPDASAIGTVTATTATLGNQVTSVITAAVYNMVPPPGVPAAFGFEASEGPIYVHILGGLDSAGNYQLSADVSELSQYGDAVGVDLRLWGNPSDPGYDPRRGRCANQGSQTSSIESNRVQCPVAATDTPLLTMPSACSGPLQMSFAADSYVDPGNFLSVFPQTRDAEGNPVGINGCSILGFDPSLTAQPDTASADSPAGLDVDLRVPQTNSHDELATANLKGTSVTLPEGMAVNPSSADGLGGCSPSEIGLTTPVGQTPAHFTAVPDTCPDSAKVGSVQIDTPLLADPLTGSVYVADQAQNPFGSLLALYVAIKDPSTGLVVKLPGKVDPDPATGQLVARFDDTPQLPFSRFQLHFKGGSRAPLISPPSCGTYTTSSRFVPWSATDPDHPTAAETVTSTDSFNVTTGPNGGSCPDYIDPARFTPEFSAGTVTPQAGAYSPFVLKIAKPDGQQSLKKIAVTLPLGLTAKLAGVPRCGQSAIVAGVGGSTNCPAGSQVGTVTVSAGAGSSPFFLADQPVYLTDGYDGAPFGLAIDTHALAGPFDLGHVVVRTKLSIDPITTQVSADAEPLPSIIQGIPLHIRSVTLKMDRSSFMLNPTSCAAQTVTGLITGGGASFTDPGDDTVKNVSSAFQVGGCSNLGLSPKLAISLTGKGQTTDNKHPGVHATVSQTAGQANLKKVTVSLPLSLALDPDNANGLCEFTDGSKVDPTCPKASIVGKATARTPILDQPLTGPVYFVKNIRKDPKSGREIRTLPKLVIPLIGENGLRLNLVGTSNVVDDRLVTTFDNIPDAPVSDFTLDINGGKGGILVVSSTDICKATQVADQQIDGQNGKTADADVYLQTTACPLKIISKKVGKTSVAVKVGGLGAGKVTVSGKGIKKTTKTIAKSTVATVTAKRTHGKPGKVTVSFDPTGPAKARKTTK